MASPGGYIQAALEQAPNAEGGANTVSSNLFYIPGTTIDFDPKPTMLERKDELRGAFAALPHSGAAKYEPEGSLEGPRLPGHPRPAPAPGDRQLRDHGRQRRHHRPRRRRHPGDRTPPRLRVEDERDPADDAAHLRAAVRRAVHQSAGSRHRRARVQGRRRRMDDDRQAARPHRRAHRRPGPDAVV